MQMCLPQMVIVNVSTLLLCIECEKVVTEQLILSASFQSVRVANFHFFTAYFLQMRWVEML